MPLSTPLLGPRRSSSTTADVDAVLSVAMAAAAAGADAAMRFFHDENLTRWDKWDGSLVTAADVAAETAVRATLDRLAPGEHVLGEEHGGSNTRDDLWIVDPVDGTENFSRGHPVWGTLVAHQVNGEVDIAVIDAPGLGRRWWAIRDGGAFTGARQDPSDRPGRRLRVSERSDRADATFGYGGLHECPSDQAVERLVATARQFRCAWGWGNFWPHVLVAEGVVDAALSYGVALWDIAAPILLVSEAGGRWSDVDGRTSLAIDSLLTSNGPLHDDLVGELTGTSRSDYVGPDATAARETSPSGH
ncbi:inositol monophosphatase family protein [Micromonospora zamorensis]|uniref:inositol monophosphatase family protein n=1 Tax=Micromonospora zamorensis TaxID=709883 RepID=UPI003D999B5D